MEMKRKMLDKAPPPAVDNEPPWKKPDIIQWLHQLQRNPELCAAISQRRTARERSAQTHFT